MLVLSRQRNERVLAGVVEITVVDIRGDNVRLGIDAPKSIPVHRQEVLLAMFAEDDKALQRLGYEINDDGLVIPCGKVIQPRRSDFRSVSVSHPLPRKELP